MPARYDNTHQALDISIGRILQMYLNDDVDQGNAQLDLVKFFDAPKNTVPPSDIQDFVHSILNEAKTGLIDASDARTELVRASVAAHEADLELAAIIQHHWNR